MGERREICRGPVVHHHRAPVFVDNYRPPEPPLERRRVGLRRVLEQPLLRLTAATSLRLLRGLRLGLLHRQIRALHRLARLRQRLHQRGHLGGRRPDRRLSSRLPESAHRSVILALRVFMRGHRRVVRLFGGRTRRVGARLLEHHHPSPRRSRFIGVVVPHPHFRAGMLRLDPSPDRRLLERHVPPERELVERADRVVRSRDVLPHVGRDLLEQSVALLVLLEHVRRPGRIFRLG